MLNEHDLAVPLVTALAGLLVTTIGFAIAWVRAREQLLRLRGEQRPPADVTLANADRLEQALSSVALEVERIGEHQRFLTNMLAEQESQPADPRKP
ncbi:MAG TPA: hypothetical protein VLN49_23185 [Gemmatimonadaceae bacterium]|nr:hypothetical protein [Gemmatimonadaceae bacterium]